MASDFRDIASTQLYRGDPQLRIEVIRRGIPSASIETLIGMVQTMVEHAANDLSGTGAKMTGGTQTKIPRGVMDAAGNRAKRYGTIVPPPSLTP